MPKLIIGLTLPNGICRETTPAQKSINAVMGKGVSGWTIVQRTAVGAGVGRNRNKVANNGKTTATRQPRESFDYDRLLFVDFDIAFSAEHVTRLLAIDAPIVTGAYQYRENRQMIHAGTWGSAPGLLGDNLPWLDQGVVSVDRCGGGFLMIKPEAFAAMPHPWFRHTIITAALNGEECSTETSEDFGFCLLAREHGIPVLCDTGCQVDHQTTRAIDADTAAAGIDFLRRANLTGAEVEKWVSVYNALTAGATDAC